MSAKPRWLVGRHVVEESLGAPGKKILQLLILLADKERYHELAEKAASVGARVRYVERHELDRAAGGAVHQGLAVQVLEQVVVGFNEFLTGLTPADKKHCLVVALDQIQDPHNFGAIARSAVCMGAKALIYPERRTAPISQAVMQASAGAIMKLPAYSVGNLAQTLLRMKDAGFWVYGADADGTAAWDVKLNFPMVLVIGSEGEGMRPLVRSYCDEVLAIPLAEAGVSSLNASCAASILLYEAVRQRDGG